MSFSPWPCSLPPPVISSVMTLLTLEGADLSHQGSVKLGLPQWSEETSGGGQGLPSVLHSLDHCHTSQRAF